MATKQVNIDIIAKDKTRQAMKSATAGINKVKDSVFNLRNALVGLGAGFVAKGFLDTAREVERLRVRFKFLFSTAQEGEKAFKGLVKFAGQVPFSLKEIQRGSANLAVVSKDADELNEILKITGDIASASGLDFATTAEQIQRTFSAGINSADLFRERAVRKMLGFEAGVQMSAEKSKEHIIKAFREGTISIVGASDEMAKTFDGTLSMIGDKFNLFQMAVMDGSPFIALKTSAELVEKSLADNFGSIEKFAEKVGDAITNTTLKVLLFGAGVIDTLQPVFNFIGKSIANLVNFVKGLPQPIATIGIIGFLAMGLKGRLVVGVIAGAIDHIRAMFGGLLDSVASVQKKIAETFKSLGLISDERFAIMMDNFENFKSSAEKLKTPIRELEEAMEQAGESGRITFEGLNLSINTTGMVAGGLKEKIVNMMKEINQAIIEANAEGFVTAENKDKTVANLSLMGEAVKNFKDGFMEAVNAQKTGFQQIKDIGKETFGKLKNTLADFVMTGKANFGDLARFVVRSFLEMLIGQAVKMAFAKSLALFKMDAIKKGMISAFQSVVTTIASIPFPLNVALAGGALAFAMGFVNKIKGFEKGGRPPVGRPSIVGEKGAELFVPDQAGTIVPNDKLGMGTKAVTVNFNISTVDARGFNELLVNSRGTIVNLINSAVNEKGKMAII
tara:strand:+ start:1850 stop:3874 length:2025 start_codon:yes stop_codon:yes gene_type:complete